MPERSDIDGEELAAPGRRFGQYAETYLRAGRRLFAEGLNDVSARTGLLYPVLYLHRHALELALKDANVWLEALIAALAEAGKLPRGDARRFDAVLAELRVHRLSTLMARLEERAKLIDDVHPVNPGVRQTVSELDRFDESGQGYRYPFYPSDGARSRIRPRGSHSTDGLSGVLENVEGAIGFLLNDFAGHLMRSLGDVEAALGAEEAQERELQASIDQMTSPYEDWTFESINPWYDEERDDPSPEMRIEWD